MTDRKTYRAKWLLADPWTVIENGYITVTGDVIEAVGSGRPPSDTPVTDLGPGVIMPPLVNAHTHLELSALKDQLPLGTGFREWTSELIRKRETFSTQSLLEHATEALSQMVASGCGAIGDISTLGITRDLLMDSPLSGLFFQEYLGSTIPEMPTIRKSTRLSRSLGAHAPHTTAPDLLREIFRLTAEAGLPMSVHLSESDNECLFIQTAKGDWADFLSSRGIDFSSWPIPARSPVQYLLDLGVLSGNLIAVHLLNASEEDLQILRAHNVSLCLCPRSNQLLHGKIPDISGFLSRGFTPCLGTDSLASAPSLSILDEMAFIIENYVSISPESVLAMGTVNGADALGLTGRFGRLQPGYHAPAFYLPIETDAPEKVCPAIVTAGNPLTQLQTVSGDSK
jgi:cytosine/adenosine deaminase-related metal-dependent hydrolase